MSEMNEVPKWVATEDPAILYRMFDRKCIDWADEVERRYQAEKSCTALVEALTRLLNQPTMNPISMSVEQRAELWHAHEQARTALANASPKKTSSNLLPPSTSNPEGK